jgi:nicotinate-nucleotide adenylyltransferase
LEKIGIFGGSFDPIHHGHLILAREALEELRLDRVLFLPAAQSPHKSRHRPASAEARWKILQAAIAHEKTFAASRIELDRPPPSYSIDTVEQLRSESPDAKLFFLIGEDNLPKLSTWRRFDELRQMVQFVVLDRTGGSVATNYPTIRRRIDISATTIRKRVAAGQSIRYLVPEAVAQIIERENLYREKTKSKPKN